MTNSTPVTRALDALGVPYRLFRHAGPVQSLEQAAAERGQQPEQVVRSLVFRLAEEQFVMVLVAGPQQIDWKRLRQAVGQARLTTADAAELQRVTGYEIGAVAPFGLPAPMRILVDQSVLAPAELSLGSGVRGTAVILSRDALQDAVRQTFGAVENVDLS